ncbi:MAG: glycosyltransferase family 4 protein [Methanophagales archaeon]|nr:glycosyltransferase family 4 protein [Methanophagales archaeon]
MKISILTPDLSHNCLGRAYLLAKILQRHYEVEIVGPIFGDVIWKPVANDRSITYKSVKIRGRFKPYWQIRELAKKIDGDVIYASKPLFTSFGVGLLKKLSDGKPLFLDIDDWQMGFMKENYSNLSFTHRFYYLAASALYFYNTGSYWNNLFGEKLPHLADEITVSNNFLKDKFGGTIVWHGRDTEAFNPRKFNREQLREKYKIGRDKKIVMFFGTPREHKGIEDLIKSIELIKNQDILLVIVGIDKDYYSQNLVKIGKEILGDGFRVFGLQPFEKVPEFLAVSDVVVIPQRRNFATIGQVPAKVFDAMAMAKPIIATNVSDLHEILDGCGWIVEPDKLEELANTIQYVLDNPEEAEEMGWKARQKCIDKYSWDAMEKILINIFRKYE